MGAFILEKVNRFSVSRPVYEDRDALKNAKNKLHRGLPPSLCCRAFTRYGF